MENSSPSATSQQSQTLFPRNAFNPWLTLAALLGTLVIIFVISLMAIFYAVGRGETTLLGAQHWANGLPGVQIQLVFEAAIIVFLVLVLPAISRMTLRAVGFRQLTGMDWLYILGGTLAMVVLANGLATLLENVLHAKVSEQAVTLFLNMKTPTAKLEFALLGIVVAPVTEEMVFRIYIFNAIQKYGRFWPGAIVSGLLFGFAHAQPGLSLLQTIILALPLALAGVLLCALYAKTGNAYVSMITHGLFNGITLVVLFLMPQLAK